MKRSEVTNSLVHLESMFQVKRYMKVTWVVLLSSLNTSKFSYLKCIQEPQAKGKETSWEQDVVFRLFLQAL